MKDLYYVFMYNQLGNARQCKTLIKHGMILVNGQKIYDPLYQVHNRDIIIYKNRILKSQPFTYIMLNKPAGYICANHDEKEKCVFDLLETKDCFCLGRLDKNTTGLLILTNDKSLKTLLLPEHHVKKTYLVTTKQVLLPQVVRQFYQGVIIDRDIKCLSADLQIIDNYHGIVTIEEGKYHQIKKMFLSVNNQVVSLHRQTFGPIILDWQLEPGEWRYLTDWERNLLLKTQKKIKE